ncbi:TorF family putative porin [Viridibacterium curvum]|uniref:TorF family putative porin n=1 Tax=Viridibacterium curvum TaxID=1101404 RepID=A0ABP9QTK0_9RHOO
MRFSRLAATLIATAASLPALAEDAPSPVTGNMTIVSDYRFRGLSQTYGGPAVQGGVDYAGPAGLYLGTWLSNVSGNQYLNGSGLEMDIYGGWKKSFGDFTLDLGTLFYYYPNAHYNNSAYTKFDNHELYVGTSYKWVTFKMSYTLTNFFGTNKDTYGGACQKTDPGYGKVAAECFGSDPGKSTGSTYWDLTANIPVTEKITINTHVGRQIVRNYGFLNYSDYKLGATYDLSGWAIGGAVIGTNAEKGWYYACDTSSPSTRCRKIGEPTFVVSVGKTF